MNMSRVSNEYIKSAHEYSESNEYVESSNEQAMNTSSKSHEYAEAINMPRQ
jgi:hypothetical protein